MLPTKRLATLIVASLALGAWAATAGADPAPETGEQSPQEEASVTKSPEQWQQELSPEQYRVLRCSATEAPFTGKFWNHHERGLYLCAGCGNPLFTSEAKFDSGSGWPSYFQPVNDAALRQRQDLSLGMERIEVMCAKCGGHLGHVFPDGPRPTGLRYCINSAALDFRPAPAD